VAVVDRGMHASVTARAALVQHELETSVKSLETLATSQRLDRDDLSLPSTSTLAGVSARQHSSTIGLIDSEGNHRLSSCMGDG
jgi:hypothetical protein